MVANELDSLAKALIITFELGEGQNSLKPQTASLQMTESQEKQPDRGETEDTSKQKVVPKPEYKLQSSSTSSAELSLSGIQWV